MSLRKLKRDLTPEKTNRRGIMHMPRPGLMPDLPVKGMKVWDRAGVVVGHMTGASFRCRLEGCGGLRITVKWPDGGLTHPCTKGVEVHKDGIRIV